MKPPARELRFALTVSILLVILSIGGYFYPAGLNWATAFLGFLPWPAMGVFILLSMGAMILIPRPRMVQYFEGLSRWADSRPSLVLAAILVLFIGGAIFLRVKASLLGDSYTLIYNFFDYQNRTSILAPWHEPLSIYLLYYAVHWLGPFQIPQLYVSFSIAEIILGCAFIVITFMTVRALFTDPAQRLSVFLFLLFIPYMEFFLGYIEIYCVSTVLIALYVLTSILVLREKKLFWMLPSLYVLTTLSHYINGLLGLSLLYIMVLKFKERKFNELLAGSGAALLVCAVVLILAHFDPSRLIDISPMSHYLSLTSDISPINQYSQPYTLLSFFHGLELLNYFIFIAPFAFCFFVWWLFNREIAFADLGTTGLWLVIAWVPILLFLLLAKIEQGFASDWDVFAGHFFIFNLLFALVFFNRPKTSGMLVFLLIAVMTLIVSSPWFVLNATREPSIRRFQSLWDKRILSHMGQYTHMLRLTRYYDAEGESANNADVWRRYTEIFPEDPRGYENEIEALAATAPEQYGRRDSVYLAWLRLDPGNAVLRGGYASLCTTEGNAVLDEGDTARSIIFYRKAIALDSTQSHALNNLGSVFAMRNDYGAAVPLFQKAIAADSNYSDACYNLGMIFLDQGNKKEGEELILRSAKLGNNSARDYLKSRHRTW